MQKSANLENYIDIGRREDSRVTPRFLVMIIGWMMVRYRKRFMEGKII